MKILYLVLAEEHYMFIPRMTVFMGSTYFCDLCVKPYNHRLNTRACSYVLHVKARHATAIYTDNLVTAHVRHANEFFMVLNAWHPIFERMEPAPTNGAHVMFATRRTWCVTIPLTSVATAIVPYAQPIDPIPTNALCPNTYFLS